VSSEFSRTVRIDTLGGTPRELAIDANEAERAALAERFGLLAVELLTAKLSLTRSGDAVSATGELRARVTQSCVATEVPVPAVVEESFSILFRPHPRTVADEEIELAEEEMDVIFYDGASVDVGEAVAETLSLSLDPYPRAPEAETVLREAGVLTEEEAKPESALAGLKDLLEGKK
jgi:uncharacterized metal-binding protein YceD (DUF177 family)